MIVLPIVILAGLAAAVSQDAPKKVTCRFSNPAYSGYCVETPNAQAGVSAADACAEILACLNSVGCEKTYCNATTVRQGWKLESATASNK